MNEWIIIGHELGTIRNRIENLQAEARSLPEDEDVQDILDANLRDSKRSRGGNSREQDGGAQRKIRTSIRCRSSRNGS